MYCASPPPAFLLSLPPPLSAVGGHVYRKRNVPLFLRRHPKPRLLSLQNPPPPPRAAFPLPSPPLPAQPLTYTSSPAERRLRSPSMARTSMFLAKLCKPPLGFPAGCSAPASPASPLGAHERETRRRPGRPAGAERDSGAEGVGPFCGLRCGFPARQLCLFTRLGSARRISPAFLIESSREQPRLGRVNLWPSLKTCD